MVPPMFTPPRTGQVQGGVKEARVVNSNHISNLNQQRDNVNPEQIREQLGGRAMSNGSAMVHCPAHNDRNPSLHVSSNDGKLLVKCHAGCEQQDVIKALQERGLWPKGNGNSKTNSPTCGPNRSLRNLPPGVQSRRDGYEYTTHWVYRDADGQIMGYAVRYDGYKDGKPDKKVIPYFKQKGESWKSKALDPTPLYKLDELAQSPGLPVLVTAEGEKAASAAGWLMQGRYVATCWQGGCSAVSKADWTPLAGRHVTIWPDADQPGRKSAQEAARQCKQAGAASIRIVNPPQSVSEGWDLADAVDEGWSPADVQEWILQNSQVVELEQQSMNTAFGFIKAGELECTAPRFIVRDYLEQNTLGVLFGDPATGKSFLAMDLAACITTGIPWRGHKVDKGAVLYIAGEGRNGIARRLRAWEIRSGISLSTAPLYLSNRPTALCDLESNKELLEAADRVSKDNPPKLVVIDTLARNFGPGDENSAKDMSMAIQAMDKIRTRFGCTVLIIHHTGHNNKNRERGSFGLRGGIDASYCLAKDDSGTVKLQPSKMKESELPEPMAFKIAPVDLGIEDEEGRNVTSAILYQVDYVSAKNGNNGQGKWQQVAAKKFQELYLQRKQYLKESGGNPDSAGVPVQEWVQACKNAGMPGNRLSEVKRSLDIQDGYIYQG